MLSFMLNLKVKKEFINNAINALSEIDRKANTHEGVITFMWFQHLEEPTRFSLLEQWENQNVLDAHIQKILDIWNDFTYCLDEDPVSTKLDKLIKVKGGQV
jgi:quinol monooxygenase YgiN